MTGALEIAEIFPANVETHRESLETVGRHAQPGGQVQVALLSETQVVMLGEHPEVALEKVVVVVIKSVIDRKGNFPEKVVPSPDEDRRVKRAEITVEIVGMHVASEPPVLYSHISLVHRRGRDITAEHQLEARFGAQVQIQLKRFGRVVVSDVREIALNFAFG